nr:MAG TPA: hypothetical protein [Inoviridae sp.]
MRKQITVSKSIRLNADTVELIELQEGKNFTDKLQAVLDDYFSGTEKRQEEMQLYQDRVDSARKRIDDYWTLSNDLAAIRRVALSAERSCNQLLDTIREELNDDS